MLIFSVKFNNVITMLNSSGVILPHFGSPHALASHLSSKLGMNARRTSSKFHVMGRISIEALLHRTSLIRPALIQACRS